MKKINKNIKNILIIRTDRVGDVVLTTPVFYQLRQSFPQARLTVLVTPLTEGLVKGNPYIDSVMVEDRRGRHQGIFGFWRLVSELRKCNFDTVINYHTKRRTNLLCFLAGIPQRIGYRNNKFGFLLTHGLTDSRHLGTQHEALYCLDVLKVFDIKSSEPRLHVPLQPEAEQWASDWFKNNKISDSKFVIAIHAGASDPTKCWPTESFIKLIKILQDKYQATIVLVGGTEVQEKAQMIKAHASWILDLTGKTTIAQLASIFKHSHLLISNDSGPVHISAALDINVISLFLRNQPGINPERWRPLGKKSFYLANKPGEEVHIDKNSKFARGQYDSISVQEVLVIVDRMQKLFKV